MASWNRQAIFVKGQLLAAEDIHIPAASRETSSCRSTYRTVQPTADLSAAVFAKSVVIQGAVHGDIVAGQSIALQNRRLSLKARGPAIAINEGASFNGKVETIREA